MVLVAAIKLAQKIWSQKDDDASVNDDALINKYRCDIYIYIYIYIYICDSFCEMLFNSFDESFRMLLIHSDKLFGRILNNSE